MEENSTNKKKGWIGGVVILVGAIALLIILLGMNEQKNEKKEMIEAKAKEHYQSFVKEIDQYVSNMDPTMDYETAKMDVITKVIEKQKTYEDGTGVAYAANKLINGISIGSFGNTGNLLDSLGTQLDDLLGSIFSSTEPQTTITLASNSVCEDDDIDVKYCVSKLSAKVYITDPKSNKWAVLVHGNMMNGKQMYDAVGDMYAKQGYNVVAPDLRGFGDSDGKVAMGYLESLDVYDWIKDLNENWKSRYGATVAPETIIVHGVSLGGATTLQLATNPDIAQAQGAPYTKNLTELHVKGFVDDCGYTSMNGIITGMLSIGNSDQMSTIFGWLNIDKNEFMNKFQSESSKLNIEGLKDIDISNITSGTDFINYFGQINEKFNQVIEDSSKYKDYLNNIKLPAINIEQPDLGDITPPNLGDIETPEFDDSAIKDWWNQNKRNRNIPEVAPKSKLGVDTSNLVDTLVSKVLMSLVGVGLTDENYAKYSDSFSAGRVFPQGSKVITIHGTSDTTVPPSNADTVKKHIENTGDAKLLYKWDVEGKPHAFVIVGSNKNQYTNLIGNFANCVNNSNLCNAFTSGGTTPIDNIIK